MVKHVEIGANILEPIRFPYPVMSKNVITESSGIQGNAFLFTE